MSENLKPLLNQLASGKTVQNSEALMMFLREHGLAFTQIEQMIALDGPLELLNEERIAAAVTPQVQVLWNINSTNDYLLQLPPLAESETVVCLAEQQSAGKGRRGKTWVSPFARHLYLSFGKSFTGTMADFSGLSLVAGLQVIEVLHEIGLTDAGLKWPNDILLPEGKLAGILVELALPRKGIVKAVIGIGLNVSAQRQQDSQIDQPWAALGQYQSISRNELAIQLINHLDEAMELFVAQGFSAFHGLWDQYNLFANKKVQVHQGGEVITGIDRGIDQHGNLLLETSTGLKSYMSGEVSLRLDS